MLDDKLQQTKKQILEDLHQHVLLVDFTKIDGSKRLMKCTLNQKILESNFGYNLAKSNNKASPQNIVTVFDLDANAWRSFRIENCNKWEKISS